MLPIRRLWIKATWYLFNYPTYKIKNRWCSVDTHFNLLSIQYMLPSTIAFIMIWAYWLSFCQIETLHFGKAERSNFLALFALTWLKFKYLVKSFIVPAIHPFIKGYSQDTARHSHILYLWLKHSVKLHTEADAFCPTFSSLPYSSWFLLH